MRLKSIEILGFKSFADKTVLSFGNGITAVVGPNGSGKSNIADAVRWVLGEQSSKSLRGLKMGDVIFGGTSKRKPLGFAEVTLVIDNTDRNIPSDTDELTVTRRYYRSGESEYRINNATVRLKDVHEMFMDTGLGRDGYSMVGQGKIDSIVETKTSDERRDIFEEAAGISRYRYRKTEAERKLASAEENLVRLRDIMGELETRVGPLAEQSKKAQKFLELSNEREYLQIGLWLDTLSKYKDDLREQEYKITAARAQYDDITSQSNKIDEQLDSFGMLSQQLIVKADEARRSSALMDEQATAIDGEINVKKNTIFHNNETIERIKGELELVKSGSDEIAVDIENKKVTVGEKNATLAKLEKELNAINEKLLNLVSESDKYSERIEQLNMQLNKNSVELSECSAKKMTAKSTIDELNNRLLTIDSSVDAQKSSMSDLEKENKVLNDELKNCDEIIVSCNNSLKGRELIVESRRKKCNEIKDKIDSLKLDMNEKLRRAQILEDLEKNMDGFAFAVKSVVKAGKESQLRGIRGAVSEIISVGSEYSIAIEVALGNSLQNIVVDSEDDAKRAIEYLKKGNGGRATFLPITSVKPRVFDPSQVKNESGYVGMANELVKFDKKYSNVVSSLLGATVVVEDIDCAVSIAKKCGYKFKIVTLDGQLINAGGSITGGSMSKNAGILSRASDIKKFREKAEAISAQIDEKSKEFEAANSNLAAVEAEILDAKSELTTAQEDKIRVLGEIKRVGEQLQILVDNIDGFNREKSQIDDRINSLNDQTNQTDTIAAEIEKKNAEYKQELDSLTGGRDETGAKRELLSENANDIRNKIFAEKKEIELLEQTIKELGDRIGGQSDRSLALNEEILAFNKQNEEINAEIITLQEQSASLREQSKNVSEQVQLFNSQREEAEKANSGYRVKQREIIEARERINGELVRLEERKLNMVRNYDEIIKRLFDEFGLTRSEAEQREIKIENISEAQKRLNVLKNEIKSLGTVNVAAIDEYKEVSERYEFMKSQMDDIENSKAELIKLINQLTEQMKVLFTQKFESINKYFSTIFAELFGGGTAELRLADPDDILNSGIDIIAQPPGKSISIIEQLSGGEKALIAISIYFAVMKVNPPPFCILDEVDAALDDVNVDRFAGYLRRMSGKSQFIIITHRRGTMEEADMLYGVTMQEKGVTKMLSLNVSQVEQSMIQ